MRLRIAICALFLALFLCLSCQKRESKEAQNAKPEAESFEPVPYSKSFETGPLKITLSLDKTHLRLDETIDLELEVLAPEEYSVELPKLESGLQQFRWEPVALSTPELQEGNLLHYSRKILLEPIVIVEKTTVKPMEVRFSCADKAGGEPKRYSLETEEVEIIVEMPPEEYWNNLTVETTLSEQPCEHLEAKRLWWPYAVGGGAILLIALVILLIRRRKIKEVEALPPMPPVWIALEELRMLIEAHLVEQGDFMGFYNAIQGILRRYIEARFDIHAPERTTEEFLDELRSTRSAIGKHQKLLENFLKHCDLVRFAKHTPDKKEIQATFDACKKFIVENQ